MCLRLRGCSGEARPLTAEVRDELLEIERADIIALRLTPTARFITRTLGAKPQHPQDVCLEVAAAEEALRIKPNGAVRGSIDLDMLEEGLCQDGQIGLFVPRAHEALPAVLGRSW